MPGSWARRCIPRTRWSSTHTLWMVCSHRGSSETESVLSPWWFPLRRLLHRRHRERNRQIRINSSNHQHLNHMSLFIYVFVSKVNRSYLHKWQRSPSPPSCCCCGTQSTSGCRWRSRHQGLYRHKTCLWKTHTWKTNPVRIMTGVISLLCMCPQLIWKQL